MRKIACLLVFAVALFLCPHTSAEQSSTSFAPPAQAGSAFEVSDAQWLLAAYDDGAWAAMQFTTVTQSVEQNFTEFRLAAGDAAVAGGPGWTIPYEAPTGFVGSFAAKLAHLERGRASLYVRGELNATVHGMEGQIFNLSEQDCISRATGASNEIRHADARYENLCPRVAGPVLVLHQNNPQAHLDFHSPFVSDAEWHNFQSSCSTDACPVSSHRTQYESHGPNWNETQGIYGFTNVAPSQPGVADGSGSPRLVVIGGSNLDVTIHGWLRMPKALGNCAGCTGGDATLKTSGEIKLNGLHSTDDGRLAGELSGDLQTASVDESPIDPKLLSSALPVAASVAATVGIVAIIKFLVWPLFTRLGPEALDQPNRKALFDIIAADPGINFRELSRRSGIAAGTTRHHLTMLVRANLVAEQGFGSTRRFFVASGKPREDWAHVVLMREPGLKQVHEFVEAHPGATQGDVLDAMGELGWSRSTAQHRLGRLVEHGSLHVRWQGRFKRYWTTAQQPTPQPLAKPATTPWPPQAKPPSA